MFDDLINQKVIKCNADIPGCAPSHSRAIFKERTTAVNNACVNPG